MGRIEGEVCGAFVEGTSEEVVTLPDGTEKPEVSQTEYCNFPLTRCKIQEFGEKMLVPCVLQGKCTVDKY